jgi:Cu/Ag efflux pump CusA
VKLSSSTNLQVDKPLYLTDCPGGIFTPWERCPLRSGIDILLPLKVIAVVFVLVFIIITAVSFPSIVILEVPVLFFTCIIALVSGEIVPNPTVPVDGKRLLCPIRERV